MQNRVLTLLNPSFNTSDELIAYVKASTMSGSGLFKEIKEFNEYKLTKLISPRVFVQISQIRNDLAMHLLSKMPKFAEHLIRNKEEVDAIFPYVTAPIAEKLLASPHIAKLVSKEEVDRFPFYSLVETYWRHPAQKKKYLASHPLDLASVKRRKKVKDKKEERSIIKEMDLAICSPPRLEKKLLDTFFTTKSFIEEALYSKVGFYSAGKVSFEEDFKTHASHPLTLPALAAAFANQLFQLRKHLLGNQTLKPEDDFNVLECGGGDGLLCRTIFSLITARGKTETEWLSLSNKLHYHLVDIAPALVERQKNATKEFKQVTVTQGDARDLKKIFPAKKMAAVISNELVDMFPTHEAKLQDNEVAITVLVPYIASSEKFAEKFPSQASKLNTFAEASKQYRTLLSHLNNAELSQFLQKRQKLLLFSKKSFLTLQSLNPEAFSYFKYSCKVTSAATPELADFAAQNADYWQRSQASSRPFYPETGVRDFMASINPILMPGGELITVDYGDNSRFLMEPLRTYKGQQVGMDIYSDFGNQDITHGVNFSVMANEGRRFGLEPCFFGYQNSMNIGDFSTKLVSLDSREAFQKHPSVQGFKILLQRKKDDRVLPNYSQRFFAKRLPVTDQEMFIIWKKDTERAKAHMLLLREAYQLHESGELLKKKEDVINSLIDAIKKYEYDVALRKACAHGLVPYVEVLLKYQPVLQFDLQAASSNGKTALDWIKEPADKTLSHASKQAMESVFEKHKVSQARDRAFSK